MAWGGISKPSKAQSAALSGIPQNPRFYRNNAVVVGVDLFAGCGGASIGMDQAGVEVAWAANHWQLAVDLHARNMPGTIHSCQDLHQCDWSTVPPHNILWASPCCQGHSKARGADRPHHDASRSTAWAVVSCAEFHRPLAVVVENVVDFLNWSLYPAWESAMRALGYTLHANHIDAADCGVPQNRVRVFITAIRGSAPLIIPPPSIPAPGADTFIDFKAGAWCQVNRPGRAKNTLERYAHGREVHGKRFLFSYYGNTRTSRSIERPIGTITTRDRWAVVNGDKMRMLTVDEARAAMGFPSTYQLPDRSRDAMHLLGNAVCPPVAKYVVEQILESGVLP